MNNVSISQDVWGRVARAVHTIENVYPQNRPAQNQVYPAICSPARLYQLAGQLVYPYDQTVPPSSESAILLKWDSDNNKYTVPDEDDQQTDTLYCPDALRDKNGHYIGLPAFTGNNPFVWAVLNTQSGNVEILWDRAGPYRAELLADLNQGGSAQALVIETFNGSDTNGAEVTVYDWLLNYGDSISNGSKVFLQWVEDDQKFWVTAAACASGTQTYFMATPMMPPLPREKEAMADVWKTVRGS